LLEGDYRELRFLGSIGISTLHQPQEETKMKGAKNNKELSTKPTDRVPLPMSTKIAGHVETFKEYSQLSGIPLNDLFEECLTEYIKEFCPAKS
jgi:hypothetical protein